MKGFVVFSSNCCEDFAQFFSPFGIILRYSSRLCFQAPIYLLPLSCVSVIFNLTLAITETYLLYFFDQHSVRLCFVPIFHFIL